MSNPKPLDRAKQPTGGWTLDTDLILDLCRAVHAEGWDVSMEAAEIVAIETERRILSAPETET